MRVEFVDLVALGQSLSPRLLVSAILPVFRTQHVMRLPPSLTGTVLETSRTDTGSCLVPEKVRVYWSCRDRPITKFWEFLRRWHVTLFQGVDEFSMPFSSKTIFPVPVVNNGPIPVAYLMRSM